MIELLSRLRHTQPWDLAIVGLKIVLNGIIRGGCENEQGGARVDNGVRKVGQGDMLAANRKFAYVEAIKLLRPTRLVHGHILQLALIIRGIRATQRERAAFRRGTDGEYITGDLLSLNKAVEERGDTGGVTGQRREGHPKNPVHGPDLEATALIEDGTEGKVGLQTSDLHLGADERALRGGLIRVAKEEGTGGGVTRGAAGTGVGTDGAGR